jgi:hypothetical protein
MSIRDTPAGSTQDQTRLRGVEGKPSAFRFVTDPQANMSHIGAIRRPGKEDDVTFAEAFIQGSEIFQHILFELPPFRSYGRNPRGTWCFIDQVDNKAAVSLGRFGIGGVEEHLPRQSRLHGTVGCRIRKIFDLIPPRRGNFCDPLAFLRTQEVIPSRPGFSGAEESAGCGARLRHAVPTLSR